MELTMNLDWKLITTDELPTFLTSSKLLSPSTSFSWKPVSFSVFYSKSSAKTEKALTSTVSSFW